MPYSIRLAAYLSVCGLLGGFLMGVLDPTPLPTAPAGMEAAAGLGIAIAIMLGAAVYALVGGLIWKSYCGRNWARIVLLAVTVVGFTAYMPHLADPWRTGTLLGLGDAFFIGCTVVGAVLFFVPDSNRWFRASDRVAQKHG